MKAFSLSHRLTLLLALPLTRPLTLIGWLSVLEAGIALGQEPQSAAQRIVVADRQLETQAASAWGLQGTLFFRSLRWSDNSASRIPVMWISQPRRLEISFFDDFNGNQPPAGAPLGPQIIQLRLADEDKVFNGIAKASRDELLARAQSVCNPEEIAGSLQLGEWADSWGWGREQTVMGYLQHLGSPSSLSAPDTVIPAKPLHAAAFLVCAKFDGMETARSSQKEQVVPTLKSSDDN